MPGGLHQYSWLCGALKYLLDAVCVSHPYLLPQHAPLFLSQSYVMQQHSVTVSWNLLLVVAIVLVSIFTLSMVIYFQLKIQLHQMNCIKIQLHPIVSLCYKNSNHLIDENDLMIICDEFHCFIELCIALSYCSPIWG